LPAAAVIEGAAEVALFVAVTLAAARVLLPGDRHRDYRNHASGLRGGFPGYGSRDVWGHWGAYYGPMIPTI
jgi:hypothetical protein